MNTIEIVNRLLKNELSATKTYQPILDKFQEDRDTCHSDCLIPIYNDHKNAVTSLQQQIWELGGSPATKLGIWSMWSKIGQGGSVIALCKQTGLLSLLEIEKNIVDDYETTLQNTELALSTRCLIEWKLLLIQKSHTRILDRLLDAELVNNLPTNNEIIMV